MVRIPKIEEPKFNKPLSNLDLIKSLNWYHENKESRESPKFVADFMKKNKIQNISHTSIKPGEGAGIHYGDSDHEHDKRKEKKEKFKN